MRIKEKRKKKQTIFRIFLVPLIGIMLVQSIITIGTLVVRRTAEMLEEYSSGMMNRLVENRKVILQNDMNQRWASIHEKEPVINESLHRFLESQGASLEELLQSGEMKGEFLAGIFPECIDSVQNESTTGIFFLFTGEDADKAGEFDGFFIRDSEPNANPANNTDLLLERGSKLLSREWNIPLDTSWTSRFHMDGQGQNASDNFFYEPWRAGREYADAETLNLGYWSMPFYLEKGQADAYEMITYSIPLRDEGNVYGVLGIEVSSRSLYDYFPVSEINNSQQSGYMLAVRQKDGSYAPLVGKGVLYNLVCSLGSRFLLEDTDYKNLSLVEGVSINREGVYAVVCPLRLYGNNAPYENTEWVLLGLNTEEELFGISRRLYFWMMVAILIGLIFGVVGIYVLVSYLTKPVQYLMRCIRMGNAGLQEFRPSNILEIDALYDVVKDLTDRQKEAENILLEEKERYRVALESSKDIFFSYDLQSHVLDIVNHKTKSGQWQCEGLEKGFLRFIDVCDADQEAVAQALGSGEDKIWAEFRMRWPGLTDDIWAALSANVVYDTDGVRRKLVGSIQDIQEQKKKEAEQLKKNTRDSVTGLYSYSAGMRCLEEHRKTQKNGVMISLFLNRLKGVNEKNGIVFGDMILEEIGNLIRSSCEELTRTSGRQTVAIRMDLEELVLWLEDQGKEQAEEWIRELLNQLTAGFETDMFNIYAHAGLVVAKGNVATETLLNMARTAREGLSAKITQGYRFYDKAERKGQAALPAPQGRDINQLGYHEEVSLVSIALNLFGKGADFPAQMVLMIRKIGRFYQAKAVLVSILRPDFNSNYLNFQWHEDGTNTEQSVRKYREEERERFLGWLGQKEARVFSKTDSEQSIIQCFLSIEAGKEGVVLPMYDSGSYMGNLCIVGLDPKYLEAPEEYQNLAELGRVIQSQINQQQYDIASKAKSEFLSRMSHEIRTPMNGIIGMTAIALQQGQSQERRMDCLQKIQSSSNYLLGLINDILDMSKIESGKMKLQPVNFNLYEMLDTIKELIAPQIAAKGIDFLQNLELVHSWFVADKMRISQVLINLLGNAVKFTPEKGTIRLTVCEQGSRGEETMVSFAVSDTGIGIAKEDQERVFRSFEQSSSATMTQQKGTGLGLSISSRLVQMMGSNIQLESEFGKGSIFSFSIPLGIGERIEAEEEDEEISFDGYHILVVEDNELNAEIAQSLLEERNFQVDCVYDGAQAVERIRATEPGTYDLILMDIMMPVMDGLEATRAIRSMERADCRTIPIVAMSANAFDDDLKKSVECGMNGHLSKPVEVDKLYRTLNDVIRGKKKPL